MYRKTLKSDGIVGLYRGFNISLVGIVVYRGLYFGKHKKDNENGRESRRERGKDADKCIIGLYDSLKPVLSPLQNNPVALGFASFLLGWGITIGAGLASYPIDTIRRRILLFLFLSLSF